MTDYTEKIKEYRKLVNDALDKAIPENKNDVTVESMRYSVFAGGKRIRPIIALAFCDALGGNITKALPFCCALEMIHTYSLIYDDLPCMDNDDLRRGKPTNHVVFGENISLMAGAALYARAFETIECSADLTDSQKLKGTRILLKASGLDGIITGQVLDLQNRKGLTVDEITKIHELKTGAMLRASALLGVVAADGDKKDENTAIEYADKIGLAFQIKDDILDVTATTESMGKTVGKDKASDKTTFADILGIENAQKKVNELTEEAKKSVLTLKNSDFLIYIADILAGRQN